MNTLRETLAPARRWSVGRWIPLELQDDCDRLIEEWRETGCEDALAAAWKAVEPWAVGAAEDAWWRGRWRFGTIIEPGDFVSLAKVLFLERLVRRWDCRRGSFMVYAAVSFKIEFYKWGGREIRRKSSEIEEAQAEMLCAPDQSQAQDARIEVEVAFRRVESRNPEQGHWARWWSEHLHVPLRELARIHAGRRGYSRSALNLRMKASQALLRRELGDGGAGRE